MPIYGKLENFHRIENKSKTFPIVVSAFTIRFQRAVTGTYNLFQTQIMAILLFLNQHAHIWKTDTMSLNI